MPHFIRDNHDHDGIDRRGFLQCKAWAARSTSPVSLSMFARTRPLRVLSIFFWSKRSESSMMDW
jgi:hypothetical protein